MKRITAAERGRLIAKRAKSKKEEKIVLTEAQEKFLESAHPSWRETIVNQVKAHNKLINSEWTLGFNDRGLGHGDYAVITKDGTIVVPCPTRELAEYLIALHNKGT